MHFCRHFFWVMLALGSTALAEPASDNSNALLLKPTPDQSQAAQLAARFLTRFHYKAEPLDEAMSAQIFDRYLDALDPDRLFFLQADIDSFKTSRDKLGNAIYDQDLSVPFAIFNLYEQRVAERNEYARSLLTQGFDFNKDESYTYEREKAPWAANQDELNDIWRKRIKNDWLRLKLAKEPNARDAHSKNADQKSRDINAEIRQTLDKRYANYADRIRQLNSEDVFQTFMNAYAMAIEPHTNYLGPRASENFDIAMKLSLEGIGAVLQRDDDYTAIREIVPGGPAALSGKLKPGDRIVGVGQGESGSLTDIVGWRLDDVVDKIRGAKDTVVRLEVLPVDSGPDGKHLQIALTRKKVSIEEQAAKSSVLDVDSGSTKHRIGVISLPTFYQDFDARKRGDANYKSATRDVAKLLADLKKQKVDGVLVDLRNNGGGSLSEATDLTGLFIDKGPVVQVRSANGHIEEEEDPHPGMAWDGPLAVLVNRNSASASEIFAAAIQDYGRGLIIGEPTYGKGTVQNLVDLDQVSQNEKPIYGELKMTIAQFFRVNGGSTQLRGVTPDISFPITVDFDQNGEQSFDNALPWTSITPAQFNTAADLKPVIPMLETRHEARAAKDHDWLALQEDIADFRKLRKQTSISLNEQVRRQERDEQEAKRLAHQQTDSNASVNPATKAKTDTTAPAVASIESADAGKGIASVDKNAADSIKGEPRQDDGLQADERSLKTELAQEQAQKTAKDVVLTEASRILSDEVELIHSDTKLAAHLLPHAELGKDIVD